VAELYSLGGIRVMTKQELIARQQVWKRKGGFETASLVVIWFASLAGLIWVKDGIEARIHAGWVDVLFTLLFFAVLVGIVPFMFWFTKRQHQRYGVACPHCGGLLAGRRIQILVAQGNCGRCGERILDEKPAA
jgi:hypothetical protein